MNTFNNFSPLAFREKSMKATYKKWYAYGKEFALPFSTTELPPFQFTVANLPSFDPTTVEVFLVDEATGTRGATGVKIKVDSMDGRGSVLYVSPGSNVYAKSIEPGVYRAEFAIPEGETYVSTPICVTDGIETNTNFVKLEYWNDEKLAYPNGFVTTGTDNDFKFQMYIPTTFFKPKYEFEEEITKRAGYKFLELQTCNKVFGFNFLAPEYICDALRLVRLSDYIRFTHDGEYYNALNFEYNPDWQDNGYLAAIECQFETDTIIQKLPSFNRRDRESFYNALLADIDTPILFSPDTVGLYYREFKQGEPTIKGKLIRELSPIDLIDENTTIAVDMGAGEARKFNLYRMLEGYISKNHEDVTEFLLSLRGGVNIGTPNSSGEHPASVDRYGNAKLKDIQGKDATLKTVETGFLTVNKTSATINGMGNANVNDLTARGDSMLRSDVYTGSKNGSHTGKITKEGQLQYLSAIIYEFLSSETFVPGFLGEGFKIWLENGNWHIECDNLTVRQTMNVFELLIQKIRSVNGAIVVSQSNGKVTAVEDTGTQYKITFGEEFPTFQEGDLIRCQSWSKNNLKFYWVEVKTAADGYVLCDKSEFNNVVPAVDDEVVQMGNTKNAERQALIYITAQESGKPYIEILNGVKTKSLTGTDRTRLGDLSNIVDPDFTGEAAVKGTGFYSTNAFLKGIFVLRNGKRVEDEIQVAKDAAAEANRNAEAALSAAETAKNRLDKWASDGFISPTEKPALIDEKKRTQSDYSQLVTQSNKYGVSTAALKTAFDAYVAQLDAHTAATPESIPVNPLLATIQAAYYAERVKSLNAISDATKALVDSAQSSADKAAQDAANAQGTANEAKNRIDKWADDGFISPTEKPALVDEKKRVEAEYLQIKADAVRYGVSVDQYTTAKTNYIAELDYHTTPTPESIAVRPALKSTQTIYYDRRNGALNAIAAAAKAAADAAKAAADKAAQDAANAQGTANAAKDRLDKWADDGFISPTEKPALIDEGKRIQAEYLQIKANADKYGVPIPQYTEAYNNYLNELRYHSAATPEDIAVRPELAQSQTIYYDRRNGALNAISDAAKSYVDEADKKLKEYLDTEITAIPGKIELAVRSLKTANYNLLLDSNHTLSANPYQLGSYKYDVHLVKGKSYTLTVCYKCADSDDVVAYNNPSFGYLAILPKSAEETIVSTKITPSNDDAEYFYFYKTPQKETTQTYIKWAVITEGDIGVATWIPSRTETSVGLKNLCSFKRIIDSGFTYASDYKDDGHFYVSPVKLHEQTKLANKDMFGLTYDPQKQYYIFVDSAIRTDGKLQESSTFFIIKYTDGTEQRICVVFPDRIEYNHIITNKPISRIVGSYGWVHGSNLRVGVYETNFPVSWSPAPEDQLYQSVKYTDTQILAVDGKIELSVTTQLNKRVIGGANLILKSGTCVAGVNRFVRFDMSKYFRDLRGKKVTISFDYEYSNLELGGNNRIGLEEPVLKDGTSEYYWIGSLKYFSSISPKAESGRFVGTITIPNDIVNSQNKGIGLIIQVGNSTNMKVCNPQIEIGDTATGWKPAPEDGVNSSIEYTKSQIDIVEKKIELKVSSTKYEEGISNAQRIARYLSTGRMLPEYSDVCFSKGLNNLKVYNNAGTEGVKIHRSSIAGVPNNTGYSCTINTTLSRGDTTPGAGGFYFGNQSRYGAMFLYKLVAAIPKGRILGFASNGIGDGGALEWLTSNVGTDKWEEYYYLIKCGTSGNLSNSGFFYITDKANVEWHLAYATVYDVFGDNSQINKTTYETKITQLESSISLKASQTDLNSATERIRQAEIKLDSTSIKLGVVEGTANDAKSTASSASSAASSAQSTANAANSLAGTANGKAEAADGRVTATQNGLVETGINIQSRKIVLKSDNVLFQNNAGQQTAAINANGKLTANAIEVGEVVANGFAAQRITTGNLTVTDGAVIAGMSISGGVLRGSNVELTNGAKIGSFVISDGIFSAQGVPAGMQMSLGSNLSTFDSSGVKIDHNSGGYALTTNGNGRVYLKGSAFWTECQDYEFIGATSWKAPGVFYAATILSNGNIGRTWGNPDFHITRVDHTATGSYTIYMSGYVGNVFPTLTCYDLNKWAYPVLSLLGGNSISYKTVDVSRRLVDCGVCIHFCGMV